MMTIVIGAGVDSRGAIITPQRLNFSARRGAARHAPSSGAASKRRAAEWAARIINETVDTSQYDRRHATDSK